ncbi:hypothetical protein K438DRAFT_1660174 [Mycena galopus ATCC 62051]|nr:hypothetical protein K438DRAFT_1660174 [Mycena galopus ATCC 62051]
MFNRYSYVPHRRLLYFLIWAVAAAELGLTAERIHFTRSNFGSYDPIVAELLVTSIFTLFWVPLTLIFHRRAPGLADRNGPAVANGHNVRGGSRFGGLHHESSGNIVLWVMWLVGAAIAAHHWPNRSAAGFGRPGSIILAIVALAFVEFGLLTLVKVLALMEYSALGVSSYGGPGMAAARPEKAVYAPTTNAATTIPAAAPAAGPV